MHGNQEERLKTTSDSGGMAMLCLRFSGITVEHDEVFLIAWDYVGYVMKGASLYPEKLFAAPPELVKQLKYGFDGTDLVIRDIEDAMRGFLV